MELLLTKLKSITVEPVLFLYMMVIFLETNAIQELIKVKSCMELVNPVNISDCSNRNQSDAVVQEKASWVGYKSVALFLFTFISCFYAASWSDKIGRKFTMLIPPLGTTLAASINCILSMYIHSHIGYILISSSISGLTFGTVGINAASFGFITDITNESSRTKRLVVLEAMMYVGGTFGIYIAGEIIKYHNYSSKINGFSLLFLYEMCVAVLVVFYIIFRIPNENDGSAVSPEISFKNLFKLDHVKATINAIIRTREAGKRKIVLLLSLALFLIYFGVVAQLTLAYYYVEDLLQWDFTKYSNFNAMQFMVQGSALFIGMPIFFDLLKVPDHIVALLGIISKLTAYAAFGLSKSDTQIYACIVCFMFSEYPVPVIRSILSKTVDVDEKGRIIAFTTMMHNFCFLIGAFIMPSIYKSTYKIFPGLCFEIVACLQACAFVIVTYLYFTRDEITATYEILENEDSSVDVTCKVERHYGSIN